MTKRDQERFPAMAVTLANGAKATIRPLATSDAEALADFYESVPREDMRFYLPYPLTRESATSNAAAAFSPCQVVLVLETPEGEIAGYAWYRWENEQSPKSGFGICIRRGHQNAGAGRALMNRLLEIARDIGPPVMALTVQKANRRAFKLYSSMGFRIVREQTRQATPELGFEEEPEYYMECRVRS